MAHNEHWLSILWRELIKPYLRNIMAAFIVLAALFLTIGSASAAPAYVTEDVNTQTTTCTPTLADYARGQGIMQYDSTYKYLVNASLYIKSTAGTPSSTIQLRVVPSSGGNPDWNNPIYSKNITSPTVPGYNWVTFDIPYVEFAAGTLYHIAMFTGDTSANKYFLCYASGSYTRGNTSYVLNADIGTPASWTIEAPGLDYTIKLSWSNETGLPPSANTTYTFNAVDLFDDSALDGVNFTTTAGSCVTAGGTCTLSYTTTQGTLTYNATLNPYFTVTSTVEPNATSTANMTQGYVNVTSVTSLVTGTVLGPALGAWTVNTTGGKTYAECTSTYPCLIHLQDGNNTLTLQYSGAATYYPKAFNVAISAPQATTTTVTGVYDALATITARNAFTLNSIATFTINASNTTHAYTDSVAAVNNVSSVPMEQGVPLFLLADAPGYALDNTTLNATNSTPAYNFDLWSNNSLRVYLYDQDTANPILSNITMVLTGNASENTYTTTSGLFFVESLTDGNYTVKLSGANYTLTTYTVTVADRSAQVLNAYLAATTDTVIFTTKDSQTAATIEGVSIGMYRLINGTLTIVESKNTDITGRAQFGYTTGVKYTFIMAKTGYSQVTFSLDPILFSTYDVALTSTVTETQSYADVSHEFTPKEYTDNTTTNFTIIFNSPNGILEQYSYTLAFPGGSATGSGTNANGGSLNASVNVTGAGLFDTVNLTINYFTVYDENVTLQYLLPINGVNVGGTIADNQNNTYGLGWFERILIATLITIILAGITTIMAGSTAGGFIGLLVLGTMMYIGFMPILAGLISIFAGVVLLAQRGG